MDYVFGTLHMCLKTTVGGVAKLYLNNFTNWLRERLNMCQPLISGLIKCVRDNIETIIRPSYSFIILHTMRFVNQETSINERFSTNCFLLSLVSLG